MHRKCCFIHVQEQKHLQGFDRCVFGPWKLFREKWAKIIHMVIQWFDKTLMIQTLCGRSNLSHFKMVDTALCNLTHHTVIHLNCYTLHIWTVTNNSGGMLFQRCWSNHILMAVYTFCESILPFMSHWSDTQNSTLSVLDSLIRYTWMRKSLLLMSTKYSILGITVLFGQCKWYKTTILCQRLTTGKLKVGQKLSRFG